MVKKAAGARASSPPPTPSRRVASGVSGQTQNASLALISPASSGSFKSAPPSPVVSRTKPSQIRVKTNNDASIPESSHKPSSGTPVAKHASKSSVDSAIDKSAPKPASDAPTSQSLSRPVPAPSTTEKIETAPAKEAEKKQSSSNATTADSRTFESQQEKQPVLPMTPKSPDPRSPAAGSASLYSEPMLPARNIPVGHDMEVVQELLSTMKQMLGTLGATFDTLGDQTIKVATFPAAIDAVHQIAAVRSQLHEQHGRQEQRMMEFKNHLQEEVRTRLYGQLKETANSIVKEVIQREIAERVRKELHEQIPQKMRDEVLQYKRQIMEVKISLHNSEARRHNALIRSNSLDEPLRPLLRPPPAGGEDTPLDELELLTPSDHGGATPLRGLDPRALPPALTIDARLRAKNKSGKGRHPFSALNEPPTPSPLFPRDLSSLMNLSPQETKVLMREYGLARLRQVAKTPVLQSSEANDIFSPNYRPEPLAGETETIEEEESREDSLNRFLSHIGVNFRLVPQPAPSSNALGLGSPLSKV